VKTKEVLGSNRSQDTCYPDWEFSWFYSFLQTHAWLVSQLGQSRFLPDPFQFIIHWSSYHSTLYSLRHVSICPSIHPSIYLSIYGSTGLCWTFGCFFSFLILYTVGRTYWTGDQPVARPLPTHRPTQTQNKRWQTSMRWVGFELMIRTFQRAKTVSALDGEARGTSSVLNKPQK
jgi:quinol-cytochrome oxidoreductase complex cytochrome b subunit